MSTTHFPEAIIMNEPEDIKEILKAAGYEVVDIDEPFGGLIPIAEAIKDAPMHWP